MAKRTIYNTVFILLALVLSMQTYAQTKASLQKKKAALSKKITYTRKLIEETKKSEQTTSTQIQLLNKQISFRNQLINNISGEILELDDNISSAEKNIENLENYKVALKEEYKKMIYDSYKNRNSYDKIMYIFSSQNFDQAYKRLKIMQQYDEVRQSQTEEITSTEQKLVETLDQLKNSKNDKQDLISDKQDEYTKLQQDKSKKDAFISDLKSQEEDLRVKINKQIADKKRIARKIEEMIAKETKNNSFAFTPAGKIISTNFEKNKGKLPWPVEKGIITQGFGKHNHPTFPGIEIYNNGVDVATEKGADINAIFQGKVTSVFEVAGSGQNLIITHGAYKTVYSNLQSTSVKKGDTIEVGDKIGTVLTKDNKSILNFQLWKSTSATESKAINPEYWISN